MNDAERFEYEIERRLSSRVWDMSIAKKSVSSVRRRRTARAAIFGGIGAAAGVAVVVLTMMLSGGRTVSIETQLVMLQVNGAHNASFSVPSGNYIDTVDMEISEVLDSR
jgi:hypothetical protein